MKGTVFEKTVQAIGSLLGIVPAPTQAKQGDIVVYGTGSGKYEHFEYFQNNSTVDTKGGVQKGPISAQPGQNPNFNNPEIYVNTNVGGTLDPKVQTTGGKTANGQTTIDKKQFKKIQNDVKAKKP